MNANIGKWMYLLLVLVVTSFLALSWSAVKLLNEAHGLSWQVGMVGFVYIAGGTLLAVYSILSILKRG